MKLENGFWLNLLLESYTNHCQENLFFETWNPQLHKKAKLKFTVEFEVHTVVVTNSSIFWNITFSSLKVNRRFRGKYCLHHHLKMECSVCYLLYASFLFGLFFDAEGGGNVTPKCRLSFNGLYGIISQKI
jgi:hypothetical protein